MVAPVAAIASVVAAATAVVVAVYAALPEAAKDVAREEFERMMQGKTDDYLKSIMAGAFEKIGLPLDPDEGINPQTITAALNDGPLAGTGIELTNVFDKEACKKDLMRVALQQALQAYGVQIKDTSADGLKAALRDHISNQISEQIAAGAGEWLDACPDLVDLSRELASAVKRGWVDESGNLLDPTQEVATDEYHVNLRERQRRYAEKHTRQWVPA